MARRASSRATTPGVLPETRPLRFDEKLVLNQWMLWLFDKKSFEQLAEPFKSADLEGLNEDNNHKFLAVFRALWKLEELPADVLLGYDQNIVKHPLQLNERRANPIRWTYFQWLSLLFTEVYLDRFFRAPDKLLADLNTFVQKFNIDKLAKDKIPTYEGMQGHSGFFFGNSRLPPEYPACRFPEEDTILWQHRPSNLQFGEAMSDQRPLHQLFGLSWIDFFRNTDYAVETEVRASASKLPQTAKKSEVGGVN